MGLKLREIRRLERIIAGCSFEVARNGTDALLQLAIPEEARLYEVQYVAGLIAQSLRLGDYSIEGTSVSFPGPTPRALAGVMVEYCSNSSSVRTEFYNQVAELRLRISEDLNKFFADDSLQSLWMARALLKQDRCIEVKFDEEGNLVLESAGVVHSGYLVNFVPLTGSDITAASFANATGFKASIPMKSLNIILKNPLVGGIIRSRAWLGMMEQTLREHGLAVAVELDGEHYRIRHTTTSALDKFLSSSVLWVGQEGKITRASLHGDDVLRVNYQVNPWLALPLAVPKADLSLVIPALVTRGVQNSEASEALTNYKVLGITEGEFADGVITLKTSEFAFPIAVDQLTSLVTSIFALNPCCDIEGPVAISSDSIRIPLTAGGIERFQEGNLFALGASLVTPSQQRGARGGRRAGSK